jgi:hypothetical protein
MASSSLHRYVDFDEPLNVEFGIDAYWNSPLESLEDATRSLLNSVDNLATSIIIAKKKCTKSPHGLTHDESAAIYLYTMETGYGSVYAVVNRLLRANNATDALPWFLYLKLLSTGVKKLPRRDCCVWRGVRGDVAKQYKKGNTVRWWSFTSCSESISVVQHFLPHAGAGTIFMIQCVSGRAITAYSKHKDENETLLMPGIRLRAVDDSLPLNGTRVVHLKEVPAAAPYIRSSSAHNLYESLQLSDDQIS